MNKHGVNVDKIFRKYPDRVPVIIVAKNLEISKHKFLIPKETTYGAFLTILRRYTNLTSKQAFIGIINRQLPKITDDFGTIFHKNNDDGVLILYLSKESTFG
jgi:hypothetical protein